MAGGSGRARRTGRTKRILLLGGASELGVAIVKQCLRRGEFEVVAAGRANSANREVSIKQLRDAGAADVEWVDFDAADTDSHKAIFESVFAKPVDMAIVAFGQLGDQNTWRDHDEAVRIAHINYVGAVSVGVLLANAMGAQGRGCIVALSSVAGERVRWTNPTYGSSKAGMDGFYLQLGVLLEPSGVQVLVVRPGAVAGRMTAGRKVALSTTPEKVAKAAMRGLDLGRPMVRIPRIFTPIVTVYKHLPASAARRLAF